MTPSQTEALRLRLERVIRASPERVFAAWTQPDQLSLWSAPKGLHIAEGEMDLRPGGAWRVVMMEPGGARHEAFGTYREVSPPHRLVYTHAWKQAGGPSPETTLTVEFLADPAGTRVVLTQEGFGSPESRDGHEGGWSSALDNLEGLFSEEA
jgi:uncharacterized protein YndB with AHSA1/START domain